MSVPVTRRQFTVDDYARMRAAEILIEDDWVELLDGEIYVMRPIGPLHGGIVNKLTHLLTRLVGDAGIISVQNPIRLSDYSEPQPDIALLRPRDDYYAHALATPEDILLLIEVADTSLGYDRDEKLPRYAQANVGEVWIIDANRHVVEQYTVPMAGEYTQIHKALPGHTITVTQLSAVSLTTDQLF